MRPKNSRLGLTTTQVLASVLAAVTATVAGSYLGVNGTIIGAAIASVLTVVGNAVYAHSIHRTRERVSTVSPAMRWMTPATLPVPARTPAVAPAPHPSSTSSNNRPDAAPAPVRVPSRPWRRAGFAMGAVFVALLTLLTTVEVVSGRPLSDLLRGESGAGTTVFGSLQSGGSSGQTPTTRITVTQTVVPKIVTETPTVTETAPPVTVTPTSPAATTTPAPSPTDSSPTGPSTP